MSSLPKIYLVKEDYKSPYPGPILFERKEIVEVGDSYKGDPDWVDWVWCIGKNNNLAWVPKQYIHFRRGQWVLKRDYNAMELSIDIGDYVDIYEIVNGFGMAEKPDGKRGWVPMKHLRNMEGDLE